MQYDIYYGLRNGKILKNRRNFACGSCGCIRETNHWKNGRRVLDNKKKSQGKEQDDRVYGKISHKSYAFKVIENEKMIKYKIDLLYSTNVPIKVIAL